MMENTVFRQRLPIYRPMSISGNEHALLRTVIDGEETSRPTTKQSGVNEQVTTESTDLVDGPGDIRNDITVAF
jgi:hypothetical protein